MLVLFLSIFFYSPQKASASISILGKNIPTSFNEVMDIALSKFVFKENNTDKLKVDNKSIDKKAEFTEKLPLSEPAISEILVDEDTVNNILNENTSGIVIAGYKLENLHVKFGENRIFLTTQINETKLDIDLSVINNGKTLKVDDVINPSNDLSFIKMFILKRIIKSINIDEIQKYLPSDARLIDNIKPIDGAINIIFKQK